MGYFSRDRLRLELVEHEDGRPDMTGGRCQWDAFGDVAFTSDSGATFFLESRSRTDLASMPRLAWSLLPPDGPWLKGAVFHDVGYRTRGDIARLGHPEPLSRHEVDDLFKEMMAALGVTAWKRNLIYATLRIAGGGAWGT